MSSLYIDTAVRVDNESEAAVVLFIDSICDKGNLCYPRIDTIMKNIHLSHSYAPVADRTMRLELGNYIINNFAYIYAGLIVNTEFRRKFMEVIAVEMSLDDKDEEYVLDIRKQMKSNQPVPSSKGNYVLNLDKWNSAFYDKFCEHIAISMKNIEPYADVIDQFISELDIDDRATIGFCIGNFAYLYRAFTYNDLFVEYVKTIIGSVKHQLSE